MQEEWQLTIPSKPGGAKFLIWDKYAESCLYTWQDRYYPFTVVYICRYLPYCRRLPENRSIPTWTKRLQNGICSKLEPTLSKHSFNMPMNKHPFKPCSCKHKQALTDVLKPISTTSAPAKTNTAVPVNTSVFLPEPNEPLIYMLFPGLISHRQLDTRIFKDK